MRGTTALKPKRYGMPVTKVKSYWSGGNLQFKNPDNNEIGPFEVAYADIVVGTEATNVVNVAIQLKDGADNDIAQRASVYAYLSDDANGDSIVATAPDGGVAIGTDGIADALTANKSFYLHSESDGDIDIDVTETGADTFYLIVVLPNGTHIVSDVLTFT
jgi:hypothetical protein